jgi:poly-gamma-glutamate synthesis protein (capsule biosynthesis protein)
MSRALTTLLLTGDVMTGRGIDQLMPTPNSPRLYEDYVHDARDYVRLAEAKSGLIARPVAYDYIWGDALARFDRLRPDLRIVNLETAITSQDQPWPGKGINYRMHPMSAACARRRSTPARSVNRHRKSTAHNVHYVNFEQHLKNRR